MHHLDIGRQLTSYAFRHPDGKRSKPANPGPRLALTCRGADGSTYPLLAYVWGAPPRPQAVRRARSHLP